MTNIISTSNNGISDFSKIVGDKDLAPGSAAVDLLEWETNEKWKYLNLMIWYVTCFVISNVLATDEIWYNQMKYILRSLIPQIFH